MNKIRNATLKIYSGGADIFPAPENHFKSFKYSDTIKGEADTAEIVLADAAGNLLSKGVIPAKNSELNINIVKQSWNSRALNEANPTLNLPPGVFELDKITYQGPPTELHLKLTSVPSKKGLRGVERNVAWENTTAADIASRAGLQLFYDVADMKICRRKLKTLTH